MLTTTFRLAFGTELIPIEEKSFLSLALFVALLLAPILALPLNYAYRDIDIATFFCQIHSFIRVVSIDRDAHRVLKSFQRYDMMQSITRCKRLMK